MFEIDGWGAGIADGYDDERITREWLTVAHDVARSTRGGQVRGTVRGPDAGRSFSSVMIDHDCAPLALLLNTPTKTVAAIATDDHPDRGGDFCCVPNAVLFVACGFQAPSADILHTPLRAEHINVLNEWERSSIRYFRPETIGEVLFNWWD